MELLMIIKAVILGIIEGLTEFLPVSSTGHLIIANKYLSFQGEFANTFAIVIQTGAIFAVILYFREKVFPRSFEKSELSKYATFWSKVIVGFIPAVVLGLLFGDIIDAKLFYPVPVAIALIVGAILLIFAEGRSKEATIFNDSDITYKKALLVGLAQCMALFPGMSRSASTIIGGMFFGFSRSLAAEFSFYLAIPTLIGAGAYKLLKSGLGYTPFEWMILGIGTVVSFIVAYFVIAFFMNYIRKRDLKPFAYYRIVLGILVILNAWFM